MDEQTEEALKMAIEAMQSAYSSHGKILTSYPAQDAWMFHGCDAKLSKSIQACKEALEEAEKKEPVAWMFIDDGNKYLNFYKCLDEGINIPLYAKENIDD